MNLRILYLVLPLLFSGCVVRSCQGRYAQWLGREECDTFCANYDGVKRYREGECSCWQSYSEKKVTRERLESAKEQIKELEDRLRYLEGIE